MSILNFINRTPGSGSGGSTTTKPLPITGILKYCLKENLPGSEDRGVMIFTTDTKELYHGNGLGLPLTRISDVLTYSHYLDFPTKGTEDKIYIDKNGKAVYFWDGTKYIYANEQGDPNDSPTMAEFAEIVRSMKFIGYKQRLIITEASDFPLILDYVPAKETIRFYVNGVRYDKPAFAYERLENKVYWLFGKSKGGFDIKNDFEIIVSYDFLYSDNNITDVPTFVNAHRKRD